MSQRVVMIVAGESSGELYGALLAKALKSHWPGVRIIGIGGERMQQAGVEIVSGISSALGLGEVIRSLKKIRISFRKAVAALRDFSPDAVVLIDYPDFNFRLAAAAKSLGIAVLYYVSPQVWAWRRKRIMTMKRIADRVAVILPFEEDLYRKAGVSCEFVGHPVMEEIEELLAGADPSSPELKRSLREAIGLGIDGTVIALLPGSRYHELMRLLPVFRDFVRASREKLRAVRFVLPLAPNVEKEPFASVIAELHNDGVIVLHGQAVRALAAADLAIVASGTATLQAALLEVPTIVVYKVSPLTYFAGKAILNVEHISLINIISKRQIVTELIQGQASVRNIMGEAEKITENEEYRTAMTASLREIRKAFLGKKPSERVAVMVGEMAGWGSRQGVA